MTPLPAGWQCARLVDICRIVSGATPKTGVPQYWGGEVRWITPNDLSRDRSQVVFEGERNLSEEGLKSCSARLFPPGSVIVSSRAPIGYVAIAGLEMSANQGCKIAIPPDFIDSRYLYWFMLQAKADLERRASGTTFKEISGREFGETSLRWPPVDEQRRIVDLLEDHLSRLDAAGTELRRAPEKLAAMRRSWVASQLTCMTAERTTVGEELVEGRGGWSRSRGHTDLSDDGVPYLKMNNIAPGGGLLVDSFIRVSGDPNDIAKYVIRPGDILFNSKNSGDLVGKTAVADARVEGWTFNENIMRLRFSDRVLPEFAGLWFHGQEFRDHVRAATRASTNVAAVYMNALRQFPMLVPSHQEQMDVVAGHARLMDAEARLVGVSKAALRRSQALRSALLKAAFGGRLTTTHEGTHV